MKVLVTGGSGFLGRHLVAELSNRPGVNVEWVNSKNFDLTNRDHVSFMMTSIRPDVVFHLAAVVGGIGANQQNPAVFFHHNMLMGLNVLDVCAKSLTRPKKLIIVGTTCSYPYEPKTIPFVEEEIFDGYPEPTNAPYGIAKRALIAGSMAYRQQYGLNAINVILANLYGPEDNFNPKTSHVIPAIIRKMYFASALGSEDARSMGHGMPVTLWGTGKPTRDFLYAADAAVGLSKLIDVYDSPEPINLGTGRELSIDYVADLISHYLGFDGPITWDARKPDGQPRRALDTTKLFRVTGWRPQTWFEDGLKRTVNWFKENPS